MRPSELVASQAALRTVLKAGHVALGWPRSGRGCSGGGTSSSALLTQAVGRVYRLREGNGTQQDIISYNLHVLCFEIHLTRTVGEPLDFSWRSVFSSISEEAKTDPENKNSKVFSA